MTETQIRAIPLRRLNLTNRVKNCLLNLDVKVETVGDLMDVLETPERLASLGNFGLRSMNNVREELHKVGVTIRGDPLSDGRNAIAREKRLLERGGQRGATVWLLESELRHISQMLPRLHENEHSIHVKIAQALQRLI